MHEEIRSPEQIFPGSLRAVLEKITLQFNPNAYSGEVKNFFEGIVEVGVFIQALKDLGEIAEKRKGDLDHSYRIGELIGRVDKFAEEIDHAVKMYNESKSERAKVDLQSRLEKIPEFVQDFLKEIKQLKSSA